MSLPSPLRRSAAVLAVLSILTVGAIESVRAQQRVRVNDDPLKRRQESPALAVDSTGRLIASWVDFRNGSPIRPEIYIATSSDGGATWSPNRRISSTEAWPTGGMEMGPMIAVDRTGGMVIDWADIRRSPNWERVDVTVARSTDGVTFTEIARINNDLPRTNHQPSIAAGGDGTIHAVWHGFPESGDAPTPVFAARSTDGGLTFTPPQRIDLYDEAATALGAGSCNCCQPFVFTDGPMNVYVAYRVDSADIRDIFLAKSTDAGATWQQARRASRGMWHFNACPGTGPRGYARNDSLYLTWMDNRTGSELPSVYLTRSTDGGATFAPDIEVAAEASFPGIAVDRIGRVFVAWSGQNVAGTFCAVSADGGATFGNAFRVSNAKPGMRSTEVACVDAPNGMVYALWRDDSNDVGDIKFSNLTELAFPVSGIAERSIDEQQLIAIAPNPAAAGTEITLSTGSAIARSIEILDPLGRRVMRLDPVSTRQRVTLPRSGVYFVVVDLGSTRHVRSCVVTR